MQALTCNGSTQALEWRKALCQRRPCDASGPSTRVRHTVVQPRAVIVVFEYILRLVQPAIGHTKRRDWRARNSSRHIALAGARHPHTRPPPATPPFQPMFAGFHVSVLDSKLGCCAFALWNSCVASEAAAAGYVISRCFCQKLKFCAMLQAQLPRLQCHPFAACACGATLTCTFCAL
jgi:hypothetical protein